MNSKRLLYLDYAKGIGILLMLFQHSIPQHNLWRHYTQAFVMPLFFIVGGFLMFIKEKYGKQKCVTHNYLLRRLKRIGIPYLIGCLLLSLFFELLSMTQGGHSITGNLYRIITLQGVESMWFLPVYFFSEILFLALARNKRVLYLSGLIALISLFFIVKFEGSPWPFALFEKTLLGFLFFIGGYLIAFSKLPRQSLLIQVLLLSSGLFCAYCNGFASFAELHNTALFLLSGLSISSFVLFISLLLESNKRVVNKVLNYYGRDTLLVLCTNNLVIECIRLLDYKTTGSFLLHYGMLGNLLMFLYLSASEAIIICLFRKLVHERF